MNHLLVELPYRGGQSRLVRGMFVFVPVPRLVIVVVVYLTFTDPLRIQPWSQDRRNQTKSNRESEISRESIQKRTDKNVASKEHVTIK